mmetsp:Transcript_337/g.909  ORF Transcript_337/g.909 Transcript_337/m.909 type:complete len:220 (-) Transcript_337:338-997(-)
MPSCVFLPVQVENHRKVLFGVPLRAVIHDAHLDLLVRLPGGEGEDPGDLGIVDTWLGRTLLCVEVHLEGELGGSGADHPDACLADVLENRHLGGLEVDTRKVVLWDSVERAPLHGHGLKLVMDGRLGGHECPHGLPLALRDAQVGLGGQRLDGAAVFVQVPLLHGDEPPELLALVREILRGRRQAPVYAGGVVGSRGRGRGVGALGHGRGPLRAFCIGG